MYLVFDIGGTNMRIATSIDGKTISQPKIVPTSKNFEQGIQTFKQIGDELSGGLQIQAVAGGVAGPLDKDKTMLVKSSHIREWIQKPLKTELARVFETSVYLENDAALAGLGEATHGSGVNHRIVAYLTIGTGVGGARIVNRRIDQNFLGFEPGHQVIVIDGPPCNCGGSGHLETYVGGSYIEKKYLQKAEEISDPKIWDEISRYLSIGIYNSIVHWSPDIVVLGGSVTKSIPLDRVEAYLGEIQTVFPSTPKLVKASLGDEAGLYGALAYLNQRVITP